MRTRAILFIERKLMYALAFVIGITAANAQVFNPPSAYEDSYPNNNMNISRTTHTSCFAWSGLSLFGPSEDIVVSAWDEPSAGGAVAWRRLQNGNPSIINAQGIIPYGSGFRDLEVGYLLVNGVFRIFVAYHKAGSGHYMDIYDLTGLGPVLLTTVPLSSQAQYSRISMDSHKLYGVAVTWEEGARIRTVVAWDNSGVIGISPVTTFIHPVGMFNPDVAFSHYTGPLLCEYVYYDPANNRFYQTSFDFWTMAGFVVNTAVFPTVQDIDVVAGPSIANIDCPDHSSISRWAYTYSVGGSDVYARIQEGGGVTTINITDGSMGIAAINSALNLHPFLAYSAAGGGNSIAIAWYTNYIDPGTSQQAAYIAAEVTSNGGGVVSSPDYLTIPNTPIIASGTPVLSLSKGTQYADYLYTIFPQYNYLLGTGYEMQHKYHDWTSTWSYKGARTHRCPDEERISGLAHTNADAALITAYPNPFNDDLSLVIPADMQTENVTVTITNVTAAVVRTFSGVAAKVNQQLRTTANLQPGLYLLQVDIPSKQITKTLKVTKAE
ncbi:MAG: T9SS type A sorting domain-containing protein [Taibaiella sp.]|nr:T9SS type A sorting domain-containing protein [Taibaiella sp.]